jgi:hypothetical protein
MTKVKYEGISNPEQWPSRMTNPIKGQWVENAQGKRYRISNVIHCSEWDFDTMTEGEPFITLILEDGFDYEY